MTINTGMLVLNTEDTIRRLTKYFIENTVLLGLNLRFGRAITRKLSETWEPLNEEARSF